VHSNAEDDRHNYEPDDHHVERLNAEGDHRSYEPDDHHDEAHDHQNYEVRDHRDEDRLSDHRNGHDLHRRHHRSVNFRGHVLVLREVGTKAHLMAGVHLLLQQGAHPLDEHA
jgi:hypothetical protein